MAEAPRAKHKLNVVLQVWTLEQFRVKVFEQLPRYFTPVRLGEVQGQVSQALDLLAAADQFGESWVTYDWPMRQGLIYLRASPYRSAELNPDLPETHPDNSLTVCAQFYTDLPPGIATVQDPDPGPYNAPQGRPKPLDGSDRFNIEREA